MFQGNWKCSKCGGVITELPFQPRSESGLTCRTCYAKSKDPAGNGSGGGSYQPGAPADVSDLGASELDTRDVPDFADFDSGTSEPMSDDGFGHAVPVEKPKVAGSWTCATCGGAITSLPFTPRDTSNLKCLDCFKRSKA